MIKAAAIVFGAGLLLLAVSCGGARKGGTDGHTEDGHEHLGATIAVGLHEWGVTADSNEASAGDVAFVVTNHGALSHELVIVKTDEPADALETHDGMVHEDDYKVVGEIENIAPGKTAEATFHLERGAYVLLCNIPGHYQSGMYATFSVGNMDHGRDDNHSNGHENDTGHDNGHEEDGGHHHDDDEGDGHHHEK